MFKFIVNIYDYTAPPGFDMKFSDGKISTALEKLKTYRKELPYETRKKD